ncbi:hypothetical protein V1523DRAFT_414264 [Lipomyces doorenjongii]
MDSSSDSYMEIDDEVYLCKMCDKVLEEGRAFELGGNRWHVECFRCSSCDAQLDCDTNLLVLGNGDLICGNCCYSCCVCGKKIDDLAILTGKDTAFCAKCFKCRNCKRPIENLRYARTSQGIFCMSCNEKLIERRRRNKLKEQQSGSRRAKSKTRSPSTITNVTTESIKDDSLNVATITTTVLEESKSKKLSSTSSTDSTCSRRSTSPSVLDKSLPPVPKDEPPRSVVGAETLSSGDTTAETVTRVTASTENNLVKPVTADAASQVQKVIIAETKEDESPSAANTCLSSLSSEAIPRHSEIGSPTDGKNSSTRFSVTTSAILNTYRDSYISSASSTTDLHSDRTIRAVPADDDDSPTDIDEVNDTPNLVIAQRTDPAGDATRRSSAGLASRANAEKVAYDTSAEDAAQEGLTASMTSTTSNGSTNNGSRRASVSSIASTSTLASFTRSSKGFLSDLSNRRSKTSFLTSKVRRISRSITIDMSNANISHSGTTPTTGASFTTATTPSSAVSAPPDFSFPRRREYQSPAIPQQPLSPPPQSLQQQQEEQDNGEALSLVPTPTSLSFKAPGDEALHASDGPASRSSTTDGNTLPLVHSSGANKSSLSYSSMLIEENPDPAPLLAVNQRKGHEPKRSISSASAGALFSNSKNPFSRSHSVSLSQASTESTSVINGASNQQKRSPFLFSGQFSAKQKDPATKDRTAGATSTLKKLGGIAKSPKAKSPRSPPRTPDKTATGSRTGTTMSLAPGPEISSSPAIRSSTDTESEFAARKANHSNYIPLPTFQDNTDFSLEEDFRNILNSQDQLAQSSPRSPRSPSRGVGVRAQRLQNLLRKPSRSTLRSFVTGAESSPATTYQTPGSPDSTHKWTQSPYISPEDVPTFMMVANERSSVFGGHDNGDSELSPPRRTLDVDDETAKLKYELVRASQRIVELEALLKIGEPDTSALEKTIEERRRTIADLEAQTTVIRKEYEVMHGGQAAEEEYDEAPNELLRRFRDEMEATKNGLQAEIQELISQRNELLDENLRLTKLRQDAVQQAEHFNAKNQQLADLNNELTRQIQERFKTHKGSPSIGSSTSGGGLFGNLRSHPSREQLAYAGRSKALGNASPGPAFLAPSSASASPAVAMENIPRESSATGSISAVLEDTLSTDATTEVARPVYSFQPSLVNSGNSSSNGGGKKKFWHRGGAAVAKGAVKGFNKMFSSDGGNSSGQWSSSGNGVNTITQDSAATGGLNILMPTSASASSGLSSAGNNSSKPGSIMRTMKFKVSSGAVEQGADEPESSLFGVDIVKRTETEGRSVPFIVTRCIQEVESRGMDYEGIYRKSGIKSQSDMIQSMFEKCELGRTLSPMTNEGLSSSSSTVSLSSASLDEKDKIASANPDVGVILTPEMIKWQDEFHELMQGDICGVTSALKQYLRHLPVPLVTYDSYAAFIAVAEHDDFERKIYRLAQIMKSLPRAHQTCLECIVRHLSRVVSHSDKNLMTSLNIAVVFAPTLVRDYSGTREMVDAHKRNEVIRFMIENSDRIFATDVSLV